MKRKVTRDPAARARAHMRAAEHYRHSDQPKAIAHYRRAIVLHRSAFGAGEVVHVTRVSLRFNGNPGSHMDLIERYDTAPCAEIIGMEGGVTEAGHLEHERDKAAKIATIIASNSGRPGGACRALDGSLKRRKVHANHETQEEDVISNWLLAATSDKNGDARYNKMNELFAPVSEAFGLTTPYGTDFKTVQYVDYTKGQGMDVNTGRWEVKGPRVYADAWCYEGATMCKKVIGSRGPSYNTDSTYTTTLVFCAAPNAQDPDDPTLTRISTPESSMRRTYSSAANMDKDYFHSGVAWAVYTALYASAQARCDTVFLPFVGGGIYAGPHRENLRIEKFKNVVDIMLEGGRLPDGTAVPGLGRCFRRVAIIEIGESKKRPHTVIAPRPYPYSEPHRPSHHAGTGAGAAAAAAASASKSLPVTFRSMGVLGLEPGDTREPSVDPGHAIVDPAGLHIIIPNNPGGAGKLSRAIYDFLEISEFPGSVTSAMKMRPEKAVYHAYNKIGHGQVHVIHVVGPNFTDLRVDLDEAAMLLQAAYESVIEVAEGLHSSISVIRVPLISGGAFAGRFRMRVPELTAKAVLAAFRERRVNKRYVLCTFGSTEEYERAFEDVARGHR